MLNEFAVQELETVGDEGAFVLLTEEGSPRKARSLSRFPTAQHLARYAGVVPQVQSSGGKTWRGATSKESKHHLKWALVEAANTVAAHQTKWTEKYPHAVGLYQRVKGTTKLSGKAKVAVARHLAEATWWILTREQDYGEPTPARVTL